MSGVSLSMFQRIIGTQLFELSSVNLHKKTYPGSFVDPVVAALGRS